MTGLEQAAKNVQNTFKIALISRGLKQVEVAEMLNTMPAQVSRAIAGNTTPKDTKEVSKTTRCTNLRRNEMEGVNKKELFTLSEEKGKQQQDIFKKTQAENITSGKLDLLTLLIIPRNDTKFYQSVNSSN
ncbi:hypothetical protein KAR50_05775 [Periweissella fabaria]|uniref:HTH cro/C1-type domain-containing protein n=1 Tax=Periweissella fabaria TaxID=546157 RepID=A0ABM8Z4B9_9LACO|nr:hypothetical protein [Periweissella fabaria]MCM0597351.1 hypothetical protein [Periweissella fabaria]CAH0416145.1 hypothetical protein WFA24289_00444 [Periweissella fabaria]